MIATIEPDVRQEDGQVVVLNGVSWATYVRLRRETDDSRLRMTYDSGVLEIMSPSFFHESTNELLSDFVKLFMRRSKIKFTPGGITTFHRKDLEKGLEPDQCFWIKNVARVRGKKHIHLPKDPPPDLVLEVDISRSSARRMKLYAMLGVPEVWRYNTTALTILRLGREGVYRPTTNSQSIRGFPVDTALALLSRLEVEDYSDLFDEFESIIKKDLQTRE